VGRGAAPLSTYDVAVVGLGIVGACAVHAIARTGARVVALDAGAPGAGTSGTSFAWLNACKKEPEHYHRLNAEGMAVHRELARELGGTPSHHDGGSLEWADEDGVSELRERVARLASRGYPAELISRERALAIEPGLAIPEPVREVAFYAADAWLDAPRLIRTLLDAATAKGAEVRPDTGVRSFRMAGDRVDALAVGRAGERGPGQDDVRARSVLVCVGPATKAFLEPLGLEMPVDRVYGLLTITSRPDTALGRVVHAPGVHLRPDAGGGLMLGTDDLNGPVVEAASATERADIARRMLERAGRVFPAARATTVAEYRVGVRPMPADRHTIAGRVPGLANAWMIATHSGVTLGALLGRLVADEIIRDTPSAMLAPFRPDRFTTR
jgi:glycine/D-amino acid oxidase-like deaminating enzyme